MDDIEIELKLFHTLRKLLPFEGDNLSNRLIVPVGTTVEGILKKIGAPQDIPLIIMINGRSVGKETTLSSNDALSIMLPAGGG